MAPPTRTTTCTQSPLENPAALEKCLTCHKSQGVEDADAMVTFVKGKMDELAQIQQATKTKLDELPQLFNVLRGDMSFVGPRPEVQEYTDLYTEEQRQVFLVRPGITGVASIRYRNENDLLAASDDPNRTYIQEILPEKLRLDLSYIPRAGVVQDIALIFETLAVVIRG